MEQIQILKKKQQQKKKQKQKNNNLDYLINPTFKSINTFFILSFKNGNDDPTRYFSYEYYRPLAEIKDFNTLIDNDLFFDQPEKNKQETYEQLVEMSRNNDYTTGDLLDYLYHQKVYKLIGIS